jgi:hypothetical protein
VNRDPDVPEADALEQEAPAGDEAVEETGEVPADLADRPEADVLEQARPVGEDHPMPRSRDHDDVNEADWLEQSIGEPAQDEEERR